MHNFKAPMKYILAVVALCLFAFPALAQSPLTTTVADTIYAENGSPQTGSLVISNPRFTSPDGYAIAASTETVTLSSNGTFSVALVPTFGGTPAGTYYTVQINPTSGPPRTEQWSVPYFPTALTISQIIVAGPGTPIPPLSGDVVGSFITSQVVGLHFGSNFVGLSSTAPINGDCLGYNSTTGQASFTYGCAGGGGSEVSSFSAQSALSPLFTTSVSNPTTTPLLSFTLSAAAADTIFGNCTGSSAAPSYCSLTTAMMPTGFCNATGGVAGQVFESNGSGCGGYADPIVSGPDAQGAAPTRNPIFISSWDGTDIRVPLTTNATPGSSDYALEVRNIPSGTQTISGSVSLTGTLPAFASTPTFNSAQSGTWTVQQGGAPWSVSQSGNWTNRIIGNAGGILDAAQNSAAPANELVAGAVYNSTLPSITNGNATQLQAGPNGGLIVDLYSYNGSSWGPASPWPADNSAFTAGTTPIGVIGAWYASSPTACTSGTMCAPSLTSDRKLFVQDFQGTSPWVVSANGGTFAVTESGTWTNTVTQATGSNLHMVCDSGCSSSAGFADNSAFTVGTTAINPIGGLYDTGADPSISNGNAGRARIDSHSYLYTDCVIGCSGGSFNNNSDAVATSATNGQTAAWLYGFNGTTFDRLRDDANKYLFVDLGTALPAGSNLIGGVNLSQVGGSGFSLGQQLAASSLPVVLTAAQLSTLTGANMSGTTPGTAPSNTTIVGTIYNASQPTPMSGQTLPLQSDGAGNLYVNVAQGAVSLTNPATVEGQYHVAFPSLTDGQASTLLLDQKGHLDIDVSRMSQQPISTAAAGTQLVGLADGIGSPLTSTKSVLDVNVKTASDVFPAAANGRSGPNGFSPTFSESIGCEYSPLLPALTLGQSAPCQSDALGRILVNVAAMPSLGIKGVADAAGTQMSFDPCQSFNRQYFNVNTSSNVQIAAGSPGKNYFICGATFPPQAAAANVAFVESATAGNACATSPAGMMGGSTAATGANIAANGGFGMPVTGYSYTHTFTPGDSICLAISAQTEGVVIFVGPI